MAQIGDDGNLRAFRHLCADLVVYVSEDCLAGRADLRIVQRAFRFGKRLPEDAEVQLLHLIFGVQHFLLIGVLLFQLFVFQLSHVVTQLRLTYFVGSARTEAVEVLLVAQFHSLAVQLHGRYLYLHLQVVQLGHILKLELLQLVAAHLLLVEFLLVVGFGAL